MEKIGSVRWGIIGCGAVCEKKAGPALAGVPHSELFAVMRRTPGLAEDFARRHSVPHHFEDAGGLLALPEVNAIYVATPDDQHEEGTIAAARAGKHVLVEKAMAHSTAACDRMIAECKTAGVVLAVAYYRRCYPSILRAKSLLASGAVGELRRIWLNDEFPLSHRLDLCHFFAGDISEIWAAEEDLPPGSHAPRGAVLHARHTAGPESITNLGWQELLAPEVVHLEGSSGVIRVQDLKAGSLEIECDGEISPEDTGPLPATHWGLVENFVNHLRGETVLACDGPEGRKSTVILDLVETLKPGAPARTITY